MRRQDEETKAQKLTSLDTQEMKVQGLSVRQRAILEGEDKLTPLEPEAERFNFIAFAEWQRAVFAELGSLFSSYRRVGK